MYQIMPNPDWAIVANWAILDLEIRIFGYGTDIAKKFKKVSNAFEKKCLDKCDLRG